MTNPSFDLGPDGEAGASSLVAAVKLNRRGLYVEIVIPGHERRADANTALQELQRRAAAATTPGGGSSRLRDDWKRESHSYIADWVRNIAITAASPGSSAPVAWIDLRDVEDQTRREVIVALNTQRDFLAADGPITLVLVFSEDADRRYCPDLMSIASVFSIFASPPKPVRTPTGPIGFLHISDLHLRGAEAWDSDIVRKNFLRDLPALLDASEVVPHLVFATGDFADRGAAEGFRRAHEFLWQVMDVCAARVPAEERVGPSGKVGVDVREWHAPRLFLVPGNHDVSRKAITRQNRAMQSMLLDLREDHTAFRKELGEWWNDNTFADLGGPRLADYYAFTRLVLGDVRQTAPDQGFRVDVVPVRGLRVGVLGLNSAWMSGEGDERNAVPVGQQQVLAALAELEVAGGADIVFALIHHPPEWWPAAERRKIQALLAQDAHVVLHGHVHDDEWVQTSGPDGELVTLTAGALYAGAGQRHAFQLGRLEPASSRLWVQALTYSDRRVGRWHPDASLGGHEKLPAGAFSFPLRRVVAAEPAGAVRATDGLVERLARLAAQRYGAVDFVGFPSESGLPAMARVDTLVVPQRFWGPHGRAGDVRYETIRDRLIAAGAEIPVQSTVEHDRQREVGVPEHSMQSGEFRTSRLFVVLGEPGAGKTLLTRSLAWHVASADVPKVPLLVPLRDWIAAAATQSLLEFAAGSLGALLSEVVSVDVVLQLAAAGRSVLLVDGFDEVVEPSQRIYVRDAVVTLAAEYPKLAILCTSRITGYRTAPLPDSFESLTLAPYDDADLDDFARRWFALQFPADPHAREGRRMRFVAALNAEPRAKELARNPLLATLIAMVHLGEAELPSERAKLYELMVRLLVETWPKNARRVFREDPRFGTAQQRRVLEQVAFFVQRIRGHEERRAVRSTSGATADTLISRVSLERVVCDSIQGVLEMQELPAMALARSWINFVAEGLGVLVEHQPGQFGFLHLSLLEYLAGCEARRSWGRDGEDALAKHLIDATAEAHNWEMVLLLLGSEQTTRTLADVVVTGVSHAEFGVRALRDDVDLSADVAFMVLDAAVTETEGRLSLTYGARELRHIRESLRQTMRFSRRHANTVKDFFLRELTHDEPTRFAACYVLASPELRALAAGRADWSSTPTHAGLDTLQVHVWRLEHERDTGARAITHLWATAELPSGPVVAVVAGTAPSIVAACICRRGQANSAAVREEVRLARAGCGVVLHSQLGALGASFAWAPAVQVAFLPIGVRYDETEWRTEPRLTEEIAMSLAMAAACLADRTCSFRLPNRSFEVYGMATIEPIEPFELSPAGYALVAARSALTSMAGSVAWSAGVELGRVRLVVDDAVQACLLAEVDPRLHLSWCVHGSSKPLGGLLRSTAEEVASVRRSAAEDESDDENYCRRLVLAFEPLAAAMLTQTAFASMSGTQRGRLRRDVFCSELSKRLTALWALWIHEEIAEHISQSETTPTAARAKIAAYALMARSILGEWPESNWLDDWRATPEPTKPEEWCERYIWRMCLAFDDPEDTARVESARAVLSDVAVNGADVDERQTAQWLQHVNLHPLTQAMMEAQSRASEEQWFKDVELYGDGDWEDRVKRLYTREPDADPAASPATPPPAKAKRKSRRKQPDA